MPDRMLCVRVSVSVSVSALVFYVLSARHVHSTRRFIILKYNSNDLTATVTHGRIHTHSTDIMSSYTPMLLLKIFGHLRGSPVLVPITLLGTPDVKSCPVATTIREKVFDAFGVISCVAFLCAPRNVNTPVFHKKLVILCIFFSIFSEVIGHMTRNN